MDFLGPFHPQLIHAPIVLLIVSFVFDVVGRAFDLSWWRKAALAMLVLGVLAGGVGVLSGEAASESAEQRQGIPEETVDHHGDTAKLAVWLALGALVTRAAVRSVGKARGAVTALSVLLHLSAAVTVGVAAHRGGQLVYVHGAAVRFHGQLLRHPATHEADTSGTPTAQH